LHALNTHFGRLLSNTQPPQDRLDAAKELPAKIREYLADCETYETLSPHTRLAGSYAQHTCVGDVKDVDFLVRVDGDPEDCDPKPRDAVNDLKAALDALPEGLGFDDGYADIDVERARRSVHVYIPSNDFHLDVVPCIAPDGLDQPLWVPDRGWGKWVASDPIGFIDHLSEVNQDWNGKAKNLIKLFKHFRDYQMKTRKPKSYWLSVLVLQELDDLDASLAMGQLFHDLLDGIYCRYDHLLTTSTTATPNLKDPMLGHNVSWNWSRAHFETFMRRIDEGRQKSQQALAESDREAAIAAWQEVFGEEYFPSSVETEAKNLATSMRPGKSFVASSGLVTAAPPLVGTAVKSQATLFHGSNEV
jgi:hypothetical protein